MEYQNVDPKSELGQQLVVSKAIAVIHAGPAAAKAAMKATETADAAKENALVARIVGKVVAQIGAKIDKLARPSGSDTQLVQKQAPMPAMSAEAIAHDRAVLARLRYDAKMYQIAGCYNKAAACRAQIEKLFG